MLLGVWDLSFPTKDQTRVPCISRRILNHWTTREVPACGPLLDIFPWSLFTSHLEGNEGLIQRGRKLENLLQDRDRENGHGLLCSMHTTGFRGGASGKEPVCHCRTHKRCGFDPCVGKIPWRRAWQSTPVFLPGESHGQKSLVGCSP